MAEIKRKTNIKKSRGMFIKDSIMIGISYMILVIVGGGVLQAIAKMMGGYDIENHVQEIDTLAKVIMLIGQSLVNFTVPAVVAFIAYAMADKPGIAPGLAMGALANSINTGFIGGAIGGLLVGYTVIAFKKLKVPKALSGIIPIMIIPTFATLISGLLMCYVFGVPIRAFMGALTGVPLSLSTGPKFVMGAVIDAMICFDYGGPVNKTAVLFVNGLNADGFLIPTSAKMCAGMTAPLGIALTTVLGGKRKLSPGEREQAKSLAILSCCYVQEGVISFLMKDPARVAISCMTGGAITDGLRMVTALKSPAVHGGALAIAMTSKPLLFIGPWALGVCVIGVLYATLGKPLPEGYVDEDVDNPLLQYSSYSTGKKECVMYVSMREMLWNVHENNCVVMTINCVNMERAKAIIQPTSKGHSAVIINISPRQMKAHGHGDIMAPMTKNMAEKVPVPVAFNLDYGANLEDMTYVMECGFSSVMIDSSSYEFEENVRRTKTVAALAHGMGLSCEAELGHVGMANQSDNTRTDLYTNPEQAKELVARTHCNCLAVAIGTVHGNYPKGFVPKLDSDRLRLLKDTLKVPLVLHGGSGAGDKSIEKVVGCGINKINVRADLFKYARQAMAGAIAAGPSIDYAGACMVTQEAMKVFIKRYMRLIGFSERYTFEKDQGLELD